MFSGMFSDMSAFSKVVFSIFIVLASFLFSFILGAFFAIPLFGVNVFNNFEILNDYGNTDYLPLFRYFQIIQSVGVFIIPPLIAAYIFRTGRSDFFGMKNFPKWIIYVCCILLMLVIQPCVNLLVELNRGIELPAIMSGVERWMNNSEEAAAVLTNLFLQMDTPSMLVFNLFMMAVIPAVGEELLFRGLLQKLFREWMGNIHIAIIISAVLFSAMHMQFYGFIPRMLLGMLFGYLMLWSGTIWVPVIAHFINNALAVIVSYLWQRGIIGTDIETFGSLGDNYSGILSFAGISAIIIYTIYKFRLQTE